MACALHAHPYSTRRPPSFCRDFRPPAAGASPRLPVAPGLHEIHESQRRRRRLGPSRECTNIKYEPYVHMSHVTTSSTRPGSAAAPWRDALVHETRAPPGASRRSCSQFRAPSLHCLARRRPWCSDHAARRRRRRRQTLRPTIWPVPVLPMTTTRTQPMRRVAREYALAARAAEKRQAAVGGRLTRVPPLVQTLS